jgi:hypothetical protein
MFHGRINANQITASKIVTIFSHKVEIQAKATQIKNAGTAHNDSRNANTVTTDIINLIFPIVFFIGKDSSIRLVNYRICVPNLFSLSII